MAGSKVNTRTNKPRNVVRRNIILLEGLMRYILSEPKILDSLPDNFELVILPDDDPEMRLYNLELLDAHGSEGKRVCVTVLGQNRNGRV